MVSGSTIGMGSGSTIGVVSGSTIGVVFRGVPVSGLSCVLSRGVTVAPCPHGSTAVTG